ncbi:MAG: BrnT family toxin [Chloroflexi bacterium]|nr:BrnT family toxin [Chloroflexota bacterium]
MEEHGQSIIVVNQLRWDPSKVAHIARHGITPDEVEEVCHGDFLVRQGYSGRLILIGPTKARRMLAVILAPTEEADAYRPVTSYPASRKFRRIYRQARGGEDL